MLLMLSHILITGKHALMQEMTGVTYILTDLDRCILHINSLILI